MANIVLQDLTAIIHGTSRFNSNQYDTVHVEILLQTSEPLPPTMNWYVPNGSSIPPEVENFFKTTNQAMYPMAEDTILKGTEDIKDEAVANKAKDVLDDATRFLLRAVMTKSNLCPIMGAPNVYKLSYDYKLYPNTANAFEFKVQLPFDGLTLPAGGTVQMAVITPIGAQIDPTATQGIATNGTPINENILNLAPINRSIVTFKWVNTDPMFTIKYHY